MVNYGCASSRSKFVAMSEELSLAGVSMEMRPTRDAQADRPRVVQMRPKQSMHFCRDVQRLSEIAFLCAPDLLVLPRRFLDGRPRRWGEGI